MMDNRQRIIEEASLMFRTYGIRAVTMDMLANQMGMSKRTIYEIFSDKDELLNGVLQWMAEKQRGLIEEVMEGSENVIEAIFKILNIMTEHFRNMSPAFKLDMKKYHNDIVAKINNSEGIPYNVNNTEMLLRGMREGVFRKDIDVSITNKCLMEVIRMTNDKDPLPPDNNIDEDVFQDFIINYLRGISTRKGLDLINFYEKNNNGSKQQRSTYNKKE
jgi:AcrR family transcriptional regulator